MINCDKSSTGCSSGNTKYAVTFLGLNSKNSYYTETDLAYKMMTLNCT